MSRLTPVRAATRGRAGLLLAAALGLGPVALGATGALAAGPVPAAPAAGEVFACDQEVPDPVERRLSDGRGALPAALRLDEAHDLADGTGVGVALIDSGTYPGTDRLFGTIPVRGGTAIAGKPRPYDAHGTLVGGLVAGRAPAGALGVAPGAHVVPVRVLDASSGVASNEDGMVRLTPDNVAAGIRWAVDNKGPAGIGVINLSLNFDEPHPAIEAQVKRALKAGIVVVAAVGNRPSPPSGEDAETWRGRYRPGENTAKFPATIPGVLGVAALDKDGTLNPATSLTGPAVDVAAPVVGAMTVNVGGTTCVLEAPASSYAAAEVSGLAALVIDRFDHKLTPAQVVTRIEATARGGFDDSALDGHGTIQPLEALTARLSIEPDGTLARPDAYVAPQPEPTLPKPRADEFAEPRRTMLWWGIGAGGALVAALLLRPLTARRRS